MTPLRLLANTEQLATTLYNSPFLSSQAENAPHRDALRVPLVLKFNDGALDLFDEIKFDDTGSRAVSDHLSRDYLIARRFRWYAEHELLQRSGTQVPPAWENPTFF